MFYAYILKNRFDKIYIGYTSKLEQRLLAHNELGKRGWTVAFRPWELILKENFNTKKLAMKREIELKSHQGRIFIRKLIQKK